MISSARGGAPVPLGADDAPLGVFDSGLGGLTVVRALRALLPHERIVYLGDTARVPYGTRSPQTVIRYARGCARVLTDRGVKAVVVACNTVSAVAVELLRAELDMSVVGVVEPGAMAAVEAVAELLPGSVPAKIGILGTAGTIASGAYPRAVAQLTTRYEVVGQAAPLLVPLVEEGWLEGEVPELAIARYVEPLVNDGARVLVLGCTHYPLLKGLIAQVAQRIAGFNIPVVDSAEATAGAVAKLMDDRRIGRATERQGQLELLVTDLPQSFGITARRFLGDAIPEPRAIDL